MHGGYLAECYVAVDRNFNKKIKYVDSMSWSI